MARQSAVWVFLIVFLGIRYELSAQEKELDINVEKSAAVFLEQYTDDFQEFFFEALKQKGIENYDRALNAFLACKKLDPKNVVVDHELAKIYTLNRSYLLAQEYAITALKAAPDNIWYLSTLIGVLEKQGRNFEELNLEGLKDNSKLLENLVVVYYNKRNYQKALKLLKTLHKSAFLIKIESKIKNSVEKSREKIESSNEATKPKLVENPIQKYKVHIDKLINSNNFTKLKQVADQALDSYPSQPYFYFAQGYALNKTGKPKKAIEILEAALDYLIDDTNLGNKIYNELAQAYTSIDNSIKANMYLRKIKS